MSSYFTSARRKAFMDQIWEGVSNHDILAKDDSLNERALGESSSRMHVYNMPREGLTKSNFLDLTRSYLQVHAYFDKSNTTAIETSEGADEAKQDIDEAKQGAESMQSTDNLGLFDVYLVAPPQKWARILDQKLGDLLLYSQGHFYHLNAGATSDGPRLDLGDVDLAYWKPFDRKISREPFTAYHIGKTDYVPDQVKQIAKWVITKMDCTCSFALNHGNFVSGLGARILCGRRETTVLLGDIFSIADFADSLASCIPTPSGFATGMQLARPNENVDTWLQRWRLNYRVETDSRGLSLCWEKGVQGLINWKTHEYHPFLRPLAVMSPRFLKPLMMASRVIPALSMAFPPPSHHGMCVAAIYCLKMGAQVPDLLMLKRFFGNLYYISARVPLTYDEFCAEMYDFLLHGLSHLSINRGFHDKELFDEGYDEQYMLTEYGLSIEDTRELPIRLPKALNTLTTKFPRGGVMCQVLIDGGTEFEPRIDL